MTTRIGAVVLAAVLVLGGCAHKVDREPAVEPPPATFGVGVVSTAVDTATAGRVGLDVYYPAQTDPSQLPRNGAAAAASSGPYPLVVFVHGAGAGAATYATMLQTIASRGYVVAAPTFPESSSPSIVGSNRALDLAEPQSLALPEIVERVRSAGIGGVPIASLLLPDELNLAGHSLGAATVIDAAFNSCCLLSEDVTSVTAISSVLLPGSGTIDLEGAPVMFAHGTNDEVIPVEQAEAAYDDAASPRYLVELVGAGHFELVQPNSPAYGPLLFSILAMLEGSSGGESVEAGLETAVASTDAVELRADP